MSNIKYNEKEEAFELPYKLWDEMMTVRFYVEDEQTIMDNLSDIAAKLEKVNGSKDRIVRLIEDEGYSEGSTDKFMSGIKIISIYVDIDEEDGAVVCFSVDCSNGSLIDKLSLELYDDEFEILGWDNA